MDRSKHDGIDIFLIVFVALYNLALQVCTALWIFSNTFSNYKKSLTDITSFQINESVTYGLFFSGVLGGSFYCLRSIYQRLGEAYTPIDSKPPNPGQTFNIKVWFFWFLYRPLQGGILALIILSLLNSHMLSTKQLTEDNIKSFYGLVAVGFLAGFGSHELIHKIQELIQVLFAKAKLASTNSEDKVKENNGKN